ncbi:MAG: spermidine/putrescine ABC transporter substrate-binding protein [Ruminococcaceae bacterium]|nr:spermidine/putrescine ABC transporter substrate-binding protein [Oscillospiraceae bacterium]
MKKLLVFLLMLTLLLGVVPMAQAEEEELFDGGRSITLNVYNWGQYIADGSDESMDIIAEFESRYPNIHVNYSTFDSNEIMYTKLAAGGITVDVIFPSDYMVARMVKENMLMELDFENIPNYQYIDENFRNMAYDPENKYSVPYTWGTVGIIYNSKYVKEEDVQAGWELLWNEKYKDKILMFDNSRDAFGIASYLLGYDVNTTDREELKACAEKLQEQEPLVQQYVMDQIYDLMENEEAWIAPYYAGDYMMMKEENDDLEFSLPENQGFNMFVDAMCIPKCAQEKEAAELFINFLCEPEIAAANMDWIGYGVPLSAAKEYMDPELIAHPVAYPSEELLSHGSAYSYLDPAVTRYVEGLFLEVRIKDGSGSSMQTVFGWAGIGVMAVLAVFAGIYGKRITNKKRKAS